MTLFTSYHNYIILYCIINFIFADDFIEIDAIEYFLNAEYELLNDNFIKAEVEYNNALKLAPNSISILKTLSDLNFNNGEYLKSMYYLERINKIKKFDPEYSIELYNIYVDLGKISKADDLLDSLKYYNLNNKEVLLLVAEKSYFIQDWEQLISTYMLLYESSNNNYLLIKRMIEIGNSFNMNEYVFQLLEKNKMKYHNIEYYKLFLESAINLEDYKSAINICIEIISLDTNHIFENIIQLAELYVKIEDYERAIELLQPLYNSNKDNFNIVYYILISYSALNNLEKELEVSKDIIKYFPELKLGYEALSNVYIKNKKFTEAIETLVNAANIFEQDSSIYLLLANLYNQLKNYNQAKLNYLEVLDREPDNFLAKYSLAILYEEINDYHNSDSLFTNILSEEQVPGILNDYAYVLSERSNITYEKLDYALDLAIKAIKLEPHNSAFLDTIGWIYFKLGKEELAKKYLEKSLTIDNKNPVILEHLGDVYLKLEDYNRAKKLYMKALDFNIDNSSIKEKIEGIDG
tara:strand:+ start:671 stop:2236 length:1566 start_codon:yes stop_codon:yes gene_type:complete